MSPRLERAVLKVLVYLWYASASVMDSHNRCSDFNNVFGKKVYGSEMDLGQKETRSSFF